MKENHLGSINLGGGETLNVPLGLEEPGSSLAMDLGEDQRARLEELHRNIGNMLKIRDDIHSNSSGNE